MAKPKVIILGGCGFIARHLIEFLVKNSLTSKIRIVDKVMPCLAYLNDNHKAIYENPLVEFVSSNLVNIASCQNAFKLDANEGVWDLVFNCASETKLAQTDAVYQEGIYKLSINCAETALQTGAKRYVELSSGCICSNETIPQSESCPIEPWNIAGKYKVKVEQKLKEMESLNYTVLRLPVVYGVGDKKGLTPRIVIAALYKHLNEKMKLLWTPTMKMNTVHVSDVVAAMWKLANDAAAERETINIVDDSNSTQGSISEILCEIFKIKVDYWGVTLSNMAKLDYAGVIEEVNDTHLGPWAKICEANSLYNTPLSPYLDTEFLYYKHINLTNDKLKTVFNYQLLVPFLTRLHVEEIINDFIEQKLFPVSLKM